jgi:hypothetical protein
MYVYDNSLSKEQNEANETEFYRILNLPKEQEAAEKVQAKREIDRQESSRSALIQATALISLAFLFFRVGHKASDDFKAVKIITIPLGLLLLILGVLLAALHNR